MKKLNQILSEAKAHIVEMTDAEIDAKNEKYNNVVVAAHVKHIEKKYGKDSIINFGSGGDDTSITSKVRNKDGRVKHVTTHHDIETLQVARHSEE